MVPCVVDAVTAITRTGQNYETVHTAILGDPEMTFSVQADREAKVALLTVPGNTRLLTYELIIGSDSNRKTELRAMNKETGTVVTQADTVDILNQGQMR